MMSLLRAGRIVAVVTSLLLSLSANAQNDMQQAQTLGSGKGLDIFNNVTSKTPTSAVVPGYNGTSQQQSQYYQGGKGEIVGPGQNRAGGCVTKGDPECTAVNLLTWGPDNRALPEFSPTDPLLTGARARMANAKNSLGTFSTAAGTTAGALSNLTTQCSPTTVVTPATYQNSICDETAQLENKTCLLDQTVVVNGVYDYTCEKTTAKKSTQTCNKTLSVTCSGATPRLSCPNGAPLINGVCHGTSVSTENASITNYTCPSGYTPSSSNCVKTETVSATISNYTCPSGSTRSGSSCITYSTETISGTPQYVCPNSYTLIPGTSTCQGSQGVTTAASIGSYSCPSGYTPSGSSCTRQISTTSAATPVYSCSSGYTPSSDGTSCSRQLSQAGTPVYGCSSGWDFGNGICTKTLTQSATASYGCPGGDVIGTNCVTKTTTSATAITTYTCTIGNAFYISPSFDTAGGWYCYTGSGYDFTLTFTPATIGTDYTCNSGMRSGSSCITTNTAPAPITYICPAGYIPSGPSGSSCVQTTTTVASITNYTCPSGYTPSSSNCVKTETVSATISNYTCPSGSTRSGSSCITYSTETISGTPQYVCPNSYTLIPGTSTCQGSQGVTTAASIGSYSCPSGYTPSGSSCTRQISTTSAATPVYSCSSGYTPSSDGTSCSRQLSQAGTPVYSCKPGGSLNADNTCTYILTVDTNPDVSYTCPTSGALTATSALNGTTTYSCCADSMQNACTGLEARAVK